MIVHRIDTPQEFDELRSPWETVHQCDPHAHIFTSWAWLRGYINCTPFEWVVLAFSADEANSRGQSQSFAHNPNGSLCTDPPAKSFVGFIFLTIERRAWNSWRTLRLGGSPMADYTGFVCLSEYEDEMMSRAAQVIQHDLKWEQFLLWDLLDPRVETFTTYFDQAHFATSRPELTPCSFIDLRELSQNEPLQLDGSDGWQNFLRIKLSKTVRKKVKRRTTQLEQLDDYQVVDSTIDNLESQIDTLFALWSQKWQQPADEGLRSIFSCLMQRGHLWLTTLWAGNRPVAALAGFVDASKGTFYAFMGAYNSDFEKRSPGIVLDGYSIKYAVEQGLSRYDYLRGDHEYKFRWGAEKRAVPRLEIMRNNPQTMLLSSAKYITKKLKSF